MFGIGGSEIIVILIVALLFLGPEKLPEAAKTISKGIRDLKKQSRLLQQQIEDDEHIGGAIRDLKSALRGDDLPVRPVKTVKKALAEAKEALDAPLPPEKAPEPPPEPPAPDKPAVTLPATAGEHDPDAPDDGDHAEELAAMIRPASGTVSHSSAQTEKSETKHG
jgi:sec-independent protein translocase protein TatB